MTARFRADGATWITVMQHFEEIPWDWIVMESYRILRCLWDPGVRKAYAFKGAKRAQLSLVNWPKGGVTLRGRSHLRANGPIGDPAQWSSKSAHREQTSLDLDPWFIVRDFIDLVLAKAGYTHYDDQIERMNADYFLNLYLRPASPMEEILLHVLATRGSAI